MMTPAAVGRWERLRSHLRTNWLTYASVLLITSVVLGVPQVLHLFEWGTPRGPAIAFYAYAAVLILVYFTTGWWIVPPNVPFRKHRRNPVSEVVVASSTDSLRQRVWHQVERHRWTIMVMSYVTGVTLVGAALLANTEGAGLIEPSIVLTFGIFFVSVAVVMTAWSAFEERTRRLLIRVLAALILLNAVGELIWWFAGLDGPVSYRYYSLWAVLHTMFCVLLFARVVDYWQAYSPVPIRAIAVALALITFASLGPRSVGTWRPATSFHGVTANAEAEKADRDQPSAILPVIDLPLADSWLAHLKMRLDAMQDGPVVLIAASGGGSRAALFTALIYEDLRRTPVRRDGAPEYRIDDHILLISSVSGGSLASACYVDDEYRQHIDSDRQDHQPRNFFTEETVSLMDEILPSIQGRPWYEGIRANGSPAEWWRAAQDCCVDERARWFFHRKFVDDMCTDFMAPLLRGMLYPLQDRGQSTMQFWQRRFGLSATNLDWHRRIAMQLAEIDANKAKEPPNLADWPPLLLCNVSEVERGTRSIIGFPPLPWDLLSNEVEAKHFPREWTAMNNDRGPPTHVSEVSLAEAVRLSAGFPWGFPVARIKPPGNDAEEIDQRDIRFVDGGVADNTGIDSLRYVIDRLKGWANLADIPGADGTPRRYVVAKEILDELMNRGVVILEIDSGAKPESPGWIAQALSGLFEPVAALRNAAYARAASTAGIHIGLIESQLPFRRARQLRWRIERLTRPIWQEATSTAARQQVFPNVKRITVICNHEDNVMTAWALGPRDKANVFMRFAAGSAKMQDEWVDHLDQYEFNRRSVDVLDRRLTSFEEMRKSGATIPLSDLEEVRQGYEFLVNRSQIERTMHDLERTVEAQLAEGTSPSAAQLAQVAAIIDVELGYRPDFTIPLPTVTAEPAQDRRTDPPKRPSTDTEVPNRRVSKVEQLQTDYSRVGAQIKQIQQKVSERNNEGMRSIQRLQSK